MVGAERVGKTLAGQIIATSELFYNEKTKLRFLLAIRDILSSEIEQLEILDEELPLRDPITGEIIHG